MFARPSFPSTTVDGNDALVSALLNASNATLRLGTSVHAVAPTADGKGFALTTNAPGSAGTRTERFDAVVVAAPLESAQLDLSALSLAPGAELRRKYVDVYVTVVTSALINGSFFGDAGMVPSALVMAPTRSTVPCGIHFVWRVGDAASAPDSAQGPGDASAVAGVYLLHSATRLSDQVVGMAFGGGARNVYRHYWPAAYPAELPTKSAAARPPVILSRGGGIYYLNALESLESAMETSALAASNVARLLARWWGERRPASRGNGAGS